MKPSPAPTPIHGPTLQLLLLNAALLIVPHIQTLSPAVIVLAFALLGWRVVAIKRPRWLPSRPLLLMLTFVLAFVIVRAHGVSLGRDASSSLLLVLMGLKLLELRRERDVLVAIYLGFFLLITPFLFDQTIPLAAYGLFMFLLLITALVVHNIKPSTLVHPSLWRISGSLVLGAVPLMLALFLLFPRIVGPLWALPDDASRAYSGISRSISPGSISELSLLDETAFRVTFNGAVPLQKELYWRGPVFWTSNGKEWTHSSLQASFQIGPDEHRLPAQAHRYHYTLIMEPHQQRWLYALDRPISVPDGVKLSRDSQLLMSSKLNRTWQVQLTSSPNLENHALSSHERFRALMLPDQLDPRVGQLAQQWRHANTDDRQIINQALRYFREQPFVYTLKPPLLGNDPVGEFLFSTRRGFCAHYATSFAILMRAAGIPSRVVAGYHGGIKNELGGFWEVRQADAHVWNEVWLFDTGWTRVDPTAAISPDRIEHSIDLAGQQASGEVSFLFHPPEGMVLWLHNVRQFWLTLDYLWQSAVLAYGPELQRDFLAGFGLHDWQDMVQALGILGAAILAVLAFILLRQAPVGVDPVQKLFLKFCRQLGKQTDPRKPFETASDYLARVGDQVPERRPALTAIATAYLRARYAGGDAGKFKRLLADYPVP